MAKRSNSRRKPRTVAPAKGGGTLAARKRGSVKPAKTYLTESHPEVEPPKVKSSLDPKDPKSHRLPRRLRALEEKMRRYPDGQR